jgi:hypothetical protein
MRKSKFTDSQIMDAVKSVEAFFAPAKCLWFRELKAQITSNSCHELKHDSIFEWRCVLKMNFSGTTI